jgi:hypothetical protein
MGTCNIDKRRQEGGKDDVVGDYESELGDDAGGYKTTPKPDQDPRTATEK